MSGNYEEGRGETWAAWEKRKRTNEPKLRVKIEENCKFCAHCTWITVGKTNRFPGFDEFYCHRVERDGKRATVDMTGRLPEACEHFTVRSKYADSN